MGAGGGEGRYTYAGEVFRRQEDDPDRAAEYLQVGYELFNGAAAPEADAEVFSIFSKALEALNLRAAMGDIGLLRAAVEGLACRAARKAALLHHLWRPRRFRALLNRFGASDPHRMRWRRWGSRSGCAPRRMWPNGWRRGRPTGRNRPSPLP